MRFYYENGMGDNGYFSENNLIKAIYTAWNIEADLWLLNEGIKKINWNERLTNQAKIIFSSLEGNEFNSDVLKKFGYKMEDGEYERDIIEIKTGKVIRYDWKDVRQLI